MNQCVVTINDQHYQGWTSLSITRSLQALSAQFNLGYTQRWPSAATIPIFAGDACTIRVNDVPIITGYIDHVNATLDAAQHQATFSGRDKTADLIDCSAKHPPGVFNQITLDRLSQVLVKPFGLQVRVLADVGKPFVRFALQTGETVFNALSRAAKRRGLLLSSNAQGDLLIIKPGSDETIGCIVEGDNLLKATTSVNTQQRFREYTVKAQRSSWNTVLAQIGKDNGTNTPGLSASTTDPAITRYRPLVLVAGNNSTQKNAESRAAWEAQVRAARSVTFTVEVAGWHSQSSLWQINRLVHLRIPSWGVDDTLLIAKVNLNLSESGTTTQLQLLSKDAFTPNPVVQQNQGSSWAKVLASVPHDN